jgi:bifunctional non-homologous end joining protein LigD
LPRVPSRICASALNVSPCRPRDCGRPTVVVPPGFIVPCLAVLRSKVTSACGLVHELKLDGYRIQAHLRDGR